MVDTNAEVSLIVADYDSQETGVTADRLRAYWLGFEPKSIGGIKADERKLQETVGTPVPVLKKIGRRLAREASRMPDDYLPLAQLLWDQYGREGRVIAAILLGAIELVEPERTMLILRELCQSCHTWEDADRLAMDAVEPIVRKEPDKWLGEMESWLDDDSRWVRRAGITVVGRLPMKHANFTRTCLSLAEKLLLEEEGVVKKAVSFAIRLCARGDVSAVRHFLDDHVPPTDIRSTWVLCDAIRSMTPSLRVDFVPLLANYERWTADPALSGRDLRSIESAIKILRTATD